MSADRGAWRLIAARDFWVRLRERSFVISTLLNVGVISILVLARAHTGTTPAFDLGVVGDASIVAVANDASSLAAGNNVTIHVVSLDAASSNQALVDGRVDAVLADGSLVGASRVNDTLQAYVQTAAHLAAIEHAFEQHHVSQAEREAAERLLPLQVAVLPGAEDAGARQQRTDAAGVAFIAVLLLYGQLFGYGTWVATGVIEEKASRVVEMLLSAVRPRQLLAGKIVGIGGLGLCQLCVIAGFAITLAAATGALDDLSGALWAAALVVGWFILGFAFYASVFAAAGARVSRMEELQNVIVPINLTILVSFIISVGTLQDPDAPISVIASILPVSSTLAMPVRIVLGAAPAWQVALSLFLLVASTIVLVPVGARIYEGAVLRTGARVKFRDAWRAAP